MIHVSEKYAEALFCAAESLGCIETVTGELPVMGELVQQCREYLDSPCAVMHEKTALLQELLSGGVSALTLEFVMIMMKRNHLRYLPGAIEQYRKMSDRYFHNVSVQLRVPFKPEFETIRQLKCRFMDEGLIPENAKRISFQIIEDKEIIGGFTAHCNGYQIDASLRTLLAKIRFAER